MEADTNSWKERHGAARNGTDSGHWLVVALTRGCTTTREDESRLFKTTSMAYVNKQHWLTGPTSLYPSL